MGAKAADIWQEIWTNYTYPEFSKAMSGDPTWNTDQFIPINRNNQVVEAYFTYGYSPLFGDDGRVKGVLTTAVETTEKIFAVNALEEKQQQQVLDGKRLEQYASELKTSLQSRDEFLSIASHELKTPVTSLKLQLQMVKRRFVASEQTFPEWESIASGINSSLKQINRLTELVEALLDVSTIQSGKINFSFQKVDVKTLMEEVVERFTDTAELSQSMIELKVPESLLMFWDRSRIDQVMVNLISNAIKYAPGPIKVEVKRISDYIQIAVRDEGPGLRPELQARIFDRFERLGVSRNISGLGLGLFIVKQIIEGHQGTITVNSKEGKGTEFIIQLPIS